MTEHAVIYERTPTGWSAYSPDIPGVYATGETRDLVHQRMQEAIPAYLAFLHEHGMAAPEPERRATAPTRA